MLFGDEHVQRYRETDGREGHEWQPGVHTLLLPDPTIHGFDAPPERETEVEAMAHITCVGSSRDEIATLRNVGLGRGSSGSMIITVPSRS